MQLYLAAYLPLYFYVSYGVTYIVLYRSYGQTHPVPIPWNGLYAERPIEKHHHGPHAWPRGLLSGLTNYDGDHQFPNWEVADHFSSLIGLRSHGDAGRLL